MKKRFKISLTISVLIILLSFIFSNSNPLIYRLYALRNTPRSTYSGGSSSFMVDNNSTLWAWGFNYHGSLGIGNTENQNEPITVMSDVKLISSSGIFTLALKNDNSLWAWGANYYGTLGDGTYNSQSLPIKIMDDVIDISAGESHSLAIKSDGSLWAWGSNEKGALGDGTNINQLTPIKIMDNVKRVSAGNNYSLIIKDDNSMWAWGSNEFGQLGDGTRNDSLIPLKIIENVKIIETSNDFSFAIKSDGTLWGWGSNYYGQLGDGTTIDKLMPTEIIGNAKDVYLGYAHTIVLLEDNTLWGWGSNSVNQLGDGTNIDHLSPIKILENVKEGSVGYDHSFAIKVDESLWGWGWNYHTQIGDGTSNNISLPTRIDKEPVQIFGIANDNYYRDDRVVTFSNGKVTLNGQSIESPFKITAEGTYTLSSFGNFGSTDNYNFTLDFTPPEIRFNDYEKNQTNSDITVVAYSDDKLNATSHTFTENGEFEFISTDLAGNQTKKTVVINNIDKDPPVVTGVKNNTFYNQSVIIEFSDGYATLNGLEISSGFLVDNEGSYDLNVFDIAGNTQSIFFTIDKTAPIILIDDYNKVMTNQDIIVNANVNEGELNKYTHTFVENGSFEFIAIDLAGNRSSLTVNINNIDKVAPIILIEPYEKGMTNKDITIIASTNEGNLNEKTHTFSVNGFFDFIATDTAGNISTIRINITNIDKIAPVVSGVENGKLYNNSIVIEFDEGVALLNGKTILSGQEIYGIGNQTLVVTDEVGNSIIIKFSVNSSTKLDASLLTNNSSKLSWIVVESATGYEIHYSKGTSLTYTLLKTQTTVSPVVQTGLTANTVYNYKVRAYRMVGTTKIYSAFSNVKTITTPPSTPVLKVVSKNSDTLSLSWVAVPGATQYELYQNSVLIDTLDSTVLSKDINGLELGSSYKFSLVALNGELRSASSVEVTGVPIPAAVGNLKLSEIRFNGFSLDWDDVTGADHYDVFQGTSSNAVTTKVGSVTDSNFTTTYLLNFNTSYYYKVVPVTLSGLNGTASMILTGKTAISAPSGVSVTTLSGSSTSVSYEAVNGAAGYEVHFSKGTSLSYTLLKTQTTVTPAVQTGLTANTVYNYKVRAYRMSGTTKVYSAFSEVKSITTPPSIPVLKVVSKDSSTLSLSWAAVPGATQYELYQNSVLVDTLTSTVLTKDISGLELGSSYKYTLVALNGELRSASSVEVTGIPVPAAVGNLKFSEIRFNGISLDWDEVTGADHYDVFQGTSSTTVTTKVGSVTESQFSTTTLLNFNTSYYYKVVPVTLGGLNGTASMILTGKTAISAPSKVNISLSSSTSTSLSWLAIDGAQGYEISFSKGLSTTYSVLRNVSSISTTHTGLSLNTKYNYRVRAYRLAGTTRIYSAYSDIKSLMTPPQAPTLKLVSKDSNTLVLTWNSIQNATSYEIYQDNVHIDTINSLSKEITSLQLGQSYQFKVVALNGELRSTDSSSVAGIPIPAAPTELKILSKNYNGFELKWNPVINSSSYEIWRSTSLNGTYSLQTITSETQFIDTKALFNTTYFYKVRAIENSIKGSFSNTISDKTILLTPTNLSVSINSTASSLSWNTVEGANGYEISYSKGTSTTYTILRSVTTLSTNHTGLTLNTVFNYRIRAYRMAGTTKVYSGYSEVKSIMTPPQAPTLKVVSKDASTLVLTWNSIQNATSYEIYQDNVLIDTINSLNKEITGLQIGQSYQFKIVALNGELRSTASSVVIGTPIPRAPIELKMLNINYNNLSFSWNPVENATSYEVVRSTSLTGTYTLLSTVSETQFSDTKALFNTNYYYKVRAIVGLIKGDYSNSIQAKTSLQKPQSIQLAATSASSSKIAWLAVDGAQGYEISYARGTSTSFTVLRSVTTLNTTHTGLILNSKYTYRIRAYRLVGTTRIYSSYSDNFVIDFNSTYVLPHLAGILGTSTSVDESKQKITDYLNSKKVGNIKFVIGDYRIGIGQIFNQTPDAMNPIHIYDLVTIYLSNS